MVDIGGISETAAAKAKELAAFASEKAKSTLGPVYDKALEKAGVDPAELASLDSLLLTAAVISVCG